MDKDLIKIVFVGGTSIVISKYHDMGHDLTLGETYLSEESNYFYILTNDLGNKFSYPKFLFKRLDEIRCKKLNIILD